MLICIHYFFTVRRHMRIFARSGKMVMNLLLLLQQRFPRVIAMTMDQLMSLRVIVTNFLLTLYRGLMQFELARNNKYRLINFNWQACTVRENLLLSKQCTPTYLLRTKTLYFGLAQPMRPMKENGFTLIQVCLIIPIGKEMNQTIR